MYEHGWSCTKNFFKLKEKADFFFFKKKNDILIEWLLVGWIKCYSTELNLWEMLKDAKTHNCVCSPALSLSHTHTRENTIWRIPKPSLQTLLIKRRGQWSPQEIHLSATPCSDRQASGPLHSPASPRRSPSSSPSQTRPGHPWKSCQISCPVDCLPWTVPDTATMQGPQWDSRDLSLETA